MARHRSVVVAGVSIILLILLLVPIPRKDRNGEYNIISRLMWCRTEGACLHEIGHRLDQEAGWVSHSDEFGEAVKTYLLVEWSGNDPSELAQAIVNLPGIFQWGGYFGDRPSEIYATIFEFSGGDRERMPDIFRTFYHWERAEALVQKMRGEQ
ncbi:MAG: hypothetical protein ACOYZ6_08170 [Chloroflexota bacterium]